MFLSFSSLAISLLSLSFRLMESCNVCHISQPDVFWLSLFLLDSFHSRHFLGHRLLSQLSCASPQAEAAFHAEIAARFRRISAHCRATPSEGRALQPIELITPRLNSHRIILRAFILITEASLITRHY